MDSGLTREEAEKKTFIHSLDCWSVNRTAETQNAAKNTSLNNYLMFITAQDTGQKQINDTHGHKGVKSFYRKKYTAWYNPRVQEWKRRLDSGEIDEPRYLYEVNMYTYICLYT
jgi:hypothetical protein